MIQQYFVEGLLFPIFFGLLKFIFNDGTWDSIFNYFGISERNFFLFGTIFLHQLFWIIFCGFFSILDYFELLQECKIKRKFKNDVSIFHSLSIILQNRLILYLLFYFLYNIHAYFGMKVKSPLPSFITIVYHQYLALLAYDLLFYLTHRCLHLYFYESIHKQHHQYKSSISIAAEYCNILEELFSTQLSSLLLPILMGFHLVSFFEIHQSGKYGFLWYGDYKVHMKHIQVIFYHIL